MIAVVRDDARVCRQTGATANSCDDNDFGQEEGKMHINAVQSFRFIGVEIASSDVLDYIKGILSFLYSYLEVQYPIIGE